MNDEFLEAAHKGIPLSDYRAEKLAGLVAENERLKAVIYDLKHTYYQPRPEGSVTVTHAEHDALLLIYMAAEAIITDGITSQTIHNLELATEKYTEMMAGVECQP